MSEERIEINGRVHRVRFLQVGGELWLHLDGETHVISSTVKSRRGRSRGDSRQESAGSDNVIAAPMPGKVTKINVKVGDAIAAEQILIVMEAMKMEYNLSAPKAGLVAAIETHEGAQVDLDQVLVRLGKVDEG